MTPDRFNCTRCRIFSISKGNGSFRRIYIPNDDYRALLISAKRELDLIFLGLAGGCADHAFVVGRSCVSNALMHMGGAYLLTVDVESFFDSISVELVSNVIPKELVDIVFEDGAPRQGLLTSPIVANMAMLDVDRRISMFCEAVGGVVYSRYADDLSFSFGQREMADYILAGVRKILGDYRLLINDAKTRLQNSKNGNFVITGVSIGPGGVKPTRKTLKRIRAAEHQGKKSHAQGLREWAKCKPPSVSPRRSSQRGRGVGAKRWPGPSRYVRLINSKPILEDEKAASHPSDAG